MSWPHARPRRSYSVAPDRVDGGQDDHLRGALEPMLLKVCTPTPRSMRSARALTLRATQNKVDVALWGHVHTYERTCGITGNFECGERDEDGMGACAAAAAARTCGAASRPRPR